MPNTTPKKKHQSASDSSSILGIWRLGDIAHQSEFADVITSQPADAVGSPRWDYIVKRARGAASSAESRRQITQFISAASSTMHPNLVAVLDGSRTGVYPYLVMPRLEGETMAIHLTAMPPKPLPVALWLTRQVAQAMEALHASGWVHGDVKPVNIMVGPRGHVTLIDLSYAARVHAPLGKLFRGTPQYAAPELLRGDTAALPAMDVCALGRVLWQWLTHIEPVSSVMLEPVADLVEGMVHDDPASRPSASQVVKRLLSLEIETLGSHIEPGRQAA